MQPIVRKVEGKGLVVVHGDRELVLPSKNFSHEKIDLTWIPWIKQVFEMGYDEGCKACESAVASVRQNQPSD